MPNRLTLEEFLKKSKAVHGDKYGYDNVKDYFKDASSKVPIVCPYHGVFYQNARSHYNGIGCKKCGYDIVATSISLFLEEFLNRSKKKHGDFYDYSKVVYSDSHTKVCIVCPIHGEFWQTPNVHFKHGCSRCSGCHKNNSEEFIQKAKKVHGDKYGYQLVKYVNAHTNVLIVCPKHGIFEQRPNTHLNGFGCFSCGVDFLKEHNPKSKSTSQFVEQAVQIHGTFYNYSKTEYVRDNKPVTIICPKHGEFTQIANYHINGRGCQKCSNSRGEMLIMSYLDNIGIKYAYQKKFSLCKDILKLPFDFYLPTENVCIEYDGEQHFRPVIALGGVDRFLVTQKHDRIKNDFCRENGIGLFRISYKDNIKNKLKTILGSWLSTLQVTSTEISVGSATRSGTKPDH